MMYFVIRFGANILFLSDLQSWPLDKSSWQSLVVLAIVLVLSRRDEVLDHSESPYRTVLAV